MNQNNCDRCSKEPEIATVTMSEAAWDRNEERHRREKKTIFIAFLIAVVLLAISNGCWLAHAIRSGAETNTTTYSFHD